MRVAIDHAMAEIVFREFAGEDDCDIPARGQHASAIILVGLAAAEG